MAVKSCHSTTRTFLTTCPDLERDRAGENSNFFNLHSKIMETDLDPPPSLKKTKLSLETVSIEKMIGVCRVWFKIYGAYPLCEYSCQCVISIFDDIYLNVPLSFREYCRFIATPFFQRLLINVNYGNIYVNLKNKTKPRFVEIQLLKE